MSSRRTFLKQGTRAAAAVALTPAHSVEAAPAFDVVIRGGTLLDGTGAPGFRADLGINADQVAAVGAIPADQGSA